jgi:hypothetical protein
MSALRPAPLDGEARGPAPRRDRDYGDSPGDRQRDFGAADKWRVFDGATWTIQSGALPIQ